MFREVSDFVDAFEGLLTFVSILFFHQRRSETASHNHEVGDFA
jgi:hypothetical protein